MRSRISQAIHAGIDASGKADGTWKLTMKHCLSPKKRYLAITMSVAANYDPGLDRERLGYALRVLTERLTRRHHGRTSKAPLLQTAFVLETPERKYAVSRETSGSYHRHIHGVIEIPGDTPVDEFAQAVLAIFSVKKNRFYAPGNNLLVQVGELNGWIEYMCKRGSHNPLTGYSMYNDLLFESLG